MTEYFSRIWRLRHFWLALVLIYIFYTQLGWIAAPLGRIDLAVVPPRTITGSLVVDSLLTGNIDALSSSFGHLVLPVLTLGIIQSLIMFDGSLSSWWTRIVIGALLFVFCVLQRVFEAGRKPGA